LSVFVIPATQEAKIGGLQFKANLGMRYRINEILAPKTSWAYDKSL
jgi:hypothetical protein